MRGKVESGYLNDDETGITPAYAGKRYSKFKTLGAKRDHPRLCGEKFRHVASKGYTLGSPPPMRGKVVPVGVVTVLSRITPAYAGKREFRRLFLDEFRDHPRLCGEKDSSHATKTFILGSPPPMRGKGSKRIFSHLLSRITPAYAGKSSKRQ